MPAGVYYNQNPIEGIMPEIARYETAYRYSGGFNLDLSNLEGQKHLPPMTPLALDFKTRKAKAVINVQVVEAYSNGNESLTIKVKKNSLAYVGMFIGNGSKGAKVTAIDKSNANYDTLTIESAFGANITKGTTLFEAAAVDGKNAKSKAIALNYAWTKVEAGATVTALGRIYEINESKLIVPISQVDKDNLGDRFMFIENAD